MNIIKSSEIIESKDMYFMTVSANAYKVSDHQNEKVDVTAWAIYEDENSKGEPVTLVAFKGADGTIYRTNSATFRRSFDNIVTFFGSDPVIPIEILGQLSKGGRLFVTCEYAG